MKISILNKNKKKNSLKSVLKCLEEERPVIRVDRKIADRARMAFDRMFAVSN